MQKTITMEEIDGNLNITQKGFSNYELFGIYTLLAEEIKNRIKESKRIVPCAAVTEKEIGKT
jgi:hypothetical protein